MNRRQEEEIYENAEMAGCGEKANEIRIDITYAVKEKK